MTDGSPGAVAGKTGGGAETQPIRWDESCLHSSYANVCNVASTREEIVLFFGANHAPHGGQQEVTAQLTDRIILSPYTAKRLAALLGNIMREHESRFGPPRVVARAPGASSGP